MVITDTGKPRTRWDGVSPAKRKKEMQRIARLRMERLTPEARKQIGISMAQAKLRKNRVV